MKRSDSAIPGLQYYRGVAASLVVLYHAACMFGPTGYAPVQSWEIVFLFGHAGVELFFVLSGFIICWIHLNRLEIPGEMASYIRKRLVRIYPPVLLVVGAWAALRLASGDAMRPEEYLVSLTLLPFNPYYAPPALWTLTHEMAFYTLFLVAFWRREAFFALVLIWGVSGFAFHQLTLFPHQGSLNALLGSPYAFLFGLGVIACLIVRQRPAPTRWVKILLALLGLALFVWASFADVHLQLAGGDAITTRRAARCLTPLFGLAGFLWIIVLADSRTRLRGMTHRTLMLLGNASFAIYLWHELPQRAFAHYLVASGLGLVQYRFWAIAIVSLSGVSLGIMVYWFVERPLLRWLNQVLGRRGGSQKNQTIIDT